ncbi:MAG: hypothetical protein M3327_07765 [Actinomycetota bacterium]|nr:hypothetical protein [Actinomycetota bacterium]
MFDEFQRLAVVAACVLVGERGGEDATMREMARSPLLASSPLPGPRVLGFVACGAVVRGDAFLAVGGFRERLMGFEETLLPVDLAREGWDLGRPGARRVVAASWKGVAD